MNKQTYIKVMNYLYEHRALRKTMVAVERIIEISVIAAYFASLIYCLYTSAGKALLSAVTCILALYLCTMLRVVADKRRPYEVYDMLPAIDKTTKGKSFPSRHLTSIGVMSITLLSLNIPIGIVFLFLTAVMGALRVLLGVHFIKDVAVGAAIGIIIGIIGMYVVPSLL